MNIDSEIQNLTDLRDWLMHHKKRLDLLNMSIPEQSIALLDLTTKRLKTTKKLCESKQSKLEL